MEELKHRVYRLIAGQLGVDEAEIADDTDLVTDLGANSLDLVELQMTCEAVFDIEIPDDVVEWMRTAGDAYDYISRVA